MNFTVVFFAHSRPELLKLSVESFLNAEDSENWKRIIVWQSGFTSMEVKINEIFSLFDIILRSDGSQSSVLSNINFNRISGMRLAFDALNSDFVLGIEEDALVSYDSLLFIRSIYENNKNKRSFRGINLGSLEAKPDVTSSGYTKLRYGLQGQAGGLTKSSWQKCFKLLKKHEGPNLGWDSTVEYYLKSGYMVTPNLSRMNDLGWHGGAHAPSDPNHHHYKRLRDNWMGLNQISPIQYKEVSVVHSWRSDAEIYRRIKFILPGLRRYSAIRNIGVRIKSLVQRINL
jgi:hypothetical protein